MALAHSPRIVTDGLVLALDAGNNKSYPGSGTSWTDLSGNGNNGTLTNGPTYNSANGGSIVFDGSNDYVDIGASSDFNLGSDNWCIEFFIKTSTKSIDNSYNRRIYMTDGPSGNTSGNLQIGISESLVIGGDNKGVISLFDTSESPIGSGSIEVSDDSWHHIAVTRIGSLMNVYVDGVFDFTAIVFGGFTSLNSGSPRLRIGAYTSSSGRFDGQISNFKFYKGKGLTAQEVQQNYNALRSRFSI